MMLRRSLLLCGFATCAAAQPWPGERVRYELELGDAGWPVGASLRVTFDHASEVDAGKSLIDGADVTVLARADGGLVALHRVLDSDSAWNRGDTTLWFAPGPGEASLSLGGPAQGLEDGTQVFLFFDDFESGTLASWPPVTGTLPPTVTVTDAGTHRGRFSFRHLPTGAGGFQLAALTPRPLPHDVVLDTWVWMDEVESAQWAWFLRFNSQRDDSYNLGPDDVGGNWRLGQRLNGSYTRYAAGIPFRPTHSKQWLRVISSVEGRHLEFCVAGECVDGGFDAPIDFTDAGVGWGRALTSSDSDGGRRLFIDDVTVRPFTARQPQVGLGARRLGEGEPCSSDSQCVSALCFSTCLSSAPDSGSGDAGSVDAGADDAGADDAGADDAGADDAGADDAGVEDPVAGSYAVGCHCGAVEPVALVGLIGFFALRRRSRAPRPAASIGPRGSARGDREIGDAVRGRRPPPTRR